jgi:hypothetical protein
MKKRVTTKSTNLNRAGNRPGHLPGKISGAMLLLVLLAMGPAQAEDIYWTNSAGGNWSSANNWNLHRVPLAADNVFVTANGTYTVAVDANATVTGLTLGGDSGVQTFDLNSPYTLTLNGASLSRTTNGVFHMNGGTLDGPGDMVLNGPLVWGAGIIKGSSLLQLKGTSRIVGPSNIRLFGRTLVNAGVLNWTGGFLGTGNGSVISNMPGAILDIATDVDISNAGTNGPGAFYNAGLVRKSGGALGGYSTAIQDVFYNTGVVEVRAGQLTLESGGSNSGSNGVWAGATLTFSGGTNILTAASILSGPGNFLCDDGLVDINGTYTITGTNTLRWYGRVTFRHPGVALIYLVMDASNGELDFLTGSSISINDLQLVNGLVGGTDDLTITNIVPWTGGGFQGTGRVQCNAGIIMDGGGGKHFLGRTLVNVGTFTWNSGPLYTGAGSVISNAPGGTFVMTDLAYGTLEDTPPTGTIANAGLMQKTGVLAHRTSLQDIILNYGTFEVQGGSLYCWRASTNVAGQSRLLAGTELEIRAPNSFWVQGGTLTGDGLLTGDVVSSGAVSPGLSAGLLTIDGDYMQTTSGVLMIELGGTTTNDYDRLRVTGSATLAGTLSAGLINNFMPASNAVFTFLSGTRVGAFTSFTHPTFLGMAVEYTTSAASMRVTNIAPAPLLTSPSMQWRYVADDIEGNHIWRLYPVLTWPAMAGAEYRLFYSTNVASSNWSAWPDSGPPFNFPAYITATGATMTVLGPSIGLRIVYHLPPSTTESVEPANFYRIQFKP